MKRKLSQPRPPLTSLLSSLLTHHTDSLAITTSQLLRGVHRPTFLASLRTKLLLESSAGELFGCNKENEIVSQQLNQGISSQGKNLEVQKIDPDDGLMTQSIGISRPIDDQMNNQITQDWTQRRNGSMLRVDGKSNCEESQVLSLY